jgi:SAM-dependent methyltransferase
MFDKRALRGWRQMLANQGFRPTFKTGVERLQSKIARRLGNPSLAAPKTHEAPAVHPFDVKYGTDTSGVLWGEHLPSGKSSDAWNTAYYGIAPSVFHKIIGSLSADLSHFSFVDFGSGKGRAVMLATAYPFREVIGVELAPALHRVAVENLAKYPVAGRRCGSVQLLNTDATEYAFPAGPSVLYFNHPFCKPVFRKVLNNLRASLSKNPRELFLIYINPEIRRVFESTPFLEKIADTKATMDPEDQSADLMGTTAEEYVMFRARVE